jgi:2-C-methyl-D-erythritol 4-phosphate cytidylyltransferase
MGCHKQFIELLGEPALFYTLHAFEEAPEIVRIYATGDRSRIENLAKESGITKYAGCAAPGESRSLSTRNGLLLLEGEAPETLVLVHDGSRCLVTPDLIKRVIVKAAQGDATDGAVPALSVSDTIKVAENGTVLETLDRAKLYAVQTPQAFQLAMLRKVYQSSTDRLRAATDDASLFENAGGRILTVAGEKTNIKLTTPEDLILAEAILKARAAPRAGGQS